MCSVNCKKIEKTLIVNKDTIIEIREKVESFDSSLFTHYNIPNIPIYDDKFYYGSKILSNI